MTMTVNEYVLGFTTDKLIVCGGVKESLDLSVIVFLINQQAMYWKIQLPMIYMLTCLTNTIHRFSSVMHILWLWIYYTITFLL